MIFCISQKKLIFRIISALRVKFMESQLKMILQKKNCMFDRYMYKIQYIKSKDDIRENLFLTPVLTCKKRKVLFVTREISGSWYDSIKDVDDIIFFIEKHFNYTSKEYKYIFHIFIESVKFEYFYLVDLKSVKKLQKFSTEQLENLLV